MEIYGKNVVKEAIMNGEEIKKVYLANQFKDDELISKLDFIFQSKEFLKIR